VAGWRAALSEAGVPVGTVLAGDWSVRSGYEAARHLVGDRSVLPGYEAARQLVGDRGVPPGYAARERGVTAIFCANDQMALGALRALHLAGRMVPDEVSVVGFDDIPEAPFLRPPLTTVRPDLAALGRASIDLLVGQITEGRRIGRHMRFPPALVKRDSTARPSCER
jgi:DNA-binding LacI/PurR family transcriptional regulator